MAQKRDVAFFEINFALQIAVYRLSAALDLERVMFNC